MAARKQQTLKPKKVKQNLKVRHLKAETRKIRECQNCITEAQFKISWRLGDVERECDQVKEETKVIVKQTALTQFKLALMFRILKAREGGDFAQAATFTHSLRELVSKEKAKAKANASTAEAKKERP